MECEPREGCKRFQAEVKAGGEAEARGAVVLGGGDGGDGGAGKIMTTGGGRKARMPENEGGASERIKAHGYACTV
jgi:hypothetical protein